MSKSILKVCHLTSVHPRYDTRIYHKICKSLNKFGFDISLIVADGEGYQNKNDIRIYDVGKEEGRLKRVIFSTFKILKKAKELNADIYHFHDPELMFIGFLLKIRKKKVIFDAHEDTPKQILGKYYIGPVFRYLFYFLINFIELILVPFYDAIITATPAISKRYIKSCKKVLVINNYPIVNELKSEGNRNIVSFVGGISNIRGIFEMVNSMEHVKEDVKLQIAGKFHPSSLIDEVSNSEGWKKVDYLNQIDRNSLRKLLQSSIAGIVLFHPAPNHIEAQPNKMFEYMEAGIAVIASNFPLWKKIIETNKCGICINPFKPTELANAIDFLASNPVEAKKMGKNGREIVEKIFNWSIEENKLIDLYNNL